MDKLFFQWVMKEVYYTKSYYK